MKIKVLQVVGNLKIGGAETVAMNIYRYIDRDKFEFHYLVYGDNIGHYEDEVKSLGGTVIHMNYSPKNISKYKSDLKNIIDQYGPYDIVHSHMMFHNGFVLKYSAKLGIPIRISHSHSANDGKFTENKIETLIKNCYLKLSQYWIKKYSMLYIACGNAAGECLYGESFFKKNGIVINNGINIKKYSYNNDIRQIMRKKYRLEGQNVYACIGHFETVKNHEFLIKIFNEIHKVNKNTKLILLGEGVLKKTIEEQVKKANLNDDVIFTGNVDNVNEWMQAIDFLLMPSLFEGVPVTLIEAQAAGLKCFVSDRVSKEVDITGSIKFISLDDDINEWINIANEKTNYQRNLNICKLSEMGYDVESNIKVIESEYLKLLESLNE